MRRDYARLNAIKDEVKRFRVAGPLPIEFEWDPITRVATASMLTLDRDSGAKTTVMLQRALAAYVEDHPNWELVKFAINEDLYAMAKEMYSHELMEQFQRDQVRVLDGHQHDAVADR